MDTKKYIYCYLGCKYISLEICSEMEVNVKEGISQRLNSLDFSLLTSNPLANFAVFDTEKHFSGDFFPLIVMAFFVLCNC